MGASRRQELLSKVDRFKPWFYAHDLGEGVITPVVQPWLVEASAVRWRMLEPELERVFGDRLRDIDCLDIACLEGYFASLIARRVRQVVAVDAREQNVEKTRFVTECHGLQNVRVMQRNVYDLSPDDVGTFEFCLCFGLLYHVEDPFYVLRRIRSVCRGACFIDTQVAQPDPVSFGWLGANQRLQTREVCAMHEEPEYKGNNSASASGMALIPSEAALLRMLRHVGFRRIEKVAPESSEFDAFATGDRVILIASV